MTSYISTETSWFEESKYVSYFTPSCMMTALMTKNLHFLTSTCLVRELCKTCYQYNTLHLDDAKKLFDSAKFELVFVYIYFENRTHVADLGSKSSPMIRGLIESLEKCEISVRFLKIFFFKCF